MIKAFVQGSLVMSTLLVLLFAWLTSIGIFKVAYMPKSGVISSSNATESQDILASWIVETSDGVKHGYANRP